jgi:hypothetical protein
MVIAAIAIPTKPKRKNVRMIANRRKAVPVA